MAKFKILWADDEIDLLKPHILFLEQKDYAVTGVNSGVEAIELIEEEPFDILFLDENMPGMSGLETLSQIKSLKPNLPVVMITKSEEENIMEEAIGNKINDYLIKPLNPNQILLSVKKILDNKRLITEKTSMSYQQEFRNLSMALQENLSWKEWIDIYKELIFWELEIEATDNEAMSEILDMQKSEANNEFSNFVKNNYEAWMNDPNIDRPILSHQLMQKKVLPHLGEQSLFCIVIDNLRYDQWKIIAPLIEEYFNMVEEDTYYSILPTTTAYARNAIFSGMTPEEMQRKHPNLWVGEEIDEGKNNNEEAFLKIQLDKKARDTKYSYHKIKNMQQGKYLAENIHQLCSNQLNMIVYNFVDMLSHARTEMEIIRSLAPDEAAYRSITKSWLIHSPLYEIIKNIAHQKAKLIITTDHGTIRVKKPFKITGDKNTNTNLRYKVGKNLSFDENSSKVFSSKTAEELRLPKISMTSSYVFASDEYFFAYPNNYNYYVNYYKDTFQHGGVSMEEVMIPIILLDPK